MIIDFDSKFKSFLENWMVSNKDKLENPEEAELEALDIYSEWLNTPAQWLDGECPADYFHKYKSAEELVSILSEYINMEVGVPDLLLDAISEHGDEAKEALTKLFRCEYNVKKEGEEECRMLAINLLAELDDTFLFDEYIDLLFDSETSEETANLIAERFEFAEKEVAEKIINKLKNVKDEEIEMRCMDVLVNFPGDERIYQKLVDMFNEYTNTSLLAAYLGKYGDERAVKILIEALDWQEINYLDYIEIRHAIEELGREVDHSRQFEGDPFYESLKNI